MFNIYLLIKCLNDYNMIGMKYYDRVGIDRLADLDWHTVVAERWGSGVTARSSPGK